MLIVFLKSIITFFLVFFIVRLMGKRELGEMQPFELVITLIIAEVACIPMNDPYIPLYAGIVPVVTLAFLQIVFSFLSRKFLFVRKVVSGTSVIVFDTNGIHYQNLAKLNMNVNDLIAALRSNGTADIMDVAYAIIETNGKISVIQKTKSAETSRVLLPIPIVVNGKWEEENLSLSGVEKVNLLNAFREGDAKDETQVVYADIRQDGTCYVSVRSGKDFSFSTQITGGNNW